MPWPGASGICLSTTSQAKLVSLGLKEGDLFQIVSTPTGAPLIREAYREALTVGAHPYLRILLNETQEVLYKQDTEAQLAYITPMDRLEVEEVKANLYILADENTKHLSGADIQKIALLRKAHQPLQDRLFARDAAGEWMWVITQFPTQAAAQDADMSLCDYEDFVYEACMLEQDDPIAV